MFKNLKRDLGEILFRRHFYLYDFFDGTNEPLLALRYIWGQQWRRDWTPPYENLLRKRTQNTTAITFGAGRMALYAILEAFDIKSGDEVIVPAFTCVVVPNAVLYRGARPVYVDIEPRTFNIDCTKIEPAITSRTKAIIAQHTFGQPCDIDLIELIAQRHHLRLIEDCAHSIGGTYHGKLLGSFGDAAFGSSDHTKIISTSTGGFALTHDSKLADKLRQIQTRALVLPRLRRFQIFYQYVVFAVLCLPRVFWVGKHIINYLWRFRVWFYFQDEGQTTKPAYYPAKLTNFQAYVGYHEMCRLEENIRHRREMAAGLERIFYQKAPSLCEGAYLRYSLLVHSPEVWEKILNKYFTVGRWFCSVTHGREAGLESVGYHSGSCPIAEKIIKQIINFPTHFRMNKTAVERLGKLLDHSALRKDMVDDRPPR